MPPGSNKEENDDNHDDDLIIDDVEESRSPSRSFIIITAIMILLFLGALVVMTLVVLNQGPTELDLEATRIVAMNMTIEFQGKQTATAGAIMEQTRIAGDNMTATALAQPTAALTASPTMTLEATETANATVLAMTSQFNLTAAAETVIVQVVTDTPGPSTVESNSAQITATALALLLQTSVTQDQNNSSTPTYTVTPTYDPVQTALAALTDAQNEIANLRTEVAQISTARAATETPLPIDSYISDLTEDRPGEFAGEVEAKLQYPKQIPANSNDYLVRLDLDVHLSKEIMALLESTPSPTPSITPDSTSQFAIDTPIPAPTSSPLLGETSGGFYLLIGESKLGAKLESHKTDEIDAVLESADIEQSVGTGQPISWVWRILAGDIEDISGTQGFTLTVYAVVNQTGELIESPEKWRRTFNVTIVPATYSFEQALEKFIPWIITAIVVGIGLKAIGDVIGEEAKHYVQGNSNTVNKRRERLFLFLFVATLVNGLIATFLFAVIRQIGWEPFGFLTAIVIIATVIWLLWRFRNWNKRSAQSPST